MKRKVLILSVAALAAFTLTAQEKKEAAPKSAAGGILHPEMAVENGTYDKPMAKLGTKPTSPGRRPRQRPAWTASRSPARPITQVGEIVDFSCYIQLGKHGEKHRSCGQKCVANGQPIGLLTADGYAVHADAGRA